MTVKKLKSNFNEEAGTVPFKADKRTPTNLNPFLLNRSWKVFGFHDPSTLHKCWIYCIGFSALLDFLATVIVESINDNREAHQSSFTMDTEEPWIHDLIQFFDKYSISFAILFSTLWFADAFVKAKQKRENKLRELDRKRLFGELDCSSTNEIVDLKGASKAYYRTVLLQLLLLPVGFYVMIWNVLRSLLSPTNIIIWKPDENLNIHYHTGAGKVDDQHYTTKTSHCLIFAILKLIVSYVAHFTGVHLKSKVKTIALRISKQLAIFAIRRPKRFLSRVRNVMTTLRWLKYLAPLIGTSNKLRENIEDLFKKYHQRREAALAKRLRERLWHEQQKDPRALEAAAAIRIQSAYRAKKTRMVVKSLHMMRYKKKELEAIRLQRVLRMLLDRARHHVTLKKQELNYLRKKQRAKELEDMVMNNKDRRRLYELQDELNVEADKLLNHKLLLRPNTTFAVTWKVLFVVCVLFEIGQLAFWPSLVKLEGQNSAKPMNISAVLHTSFVPKPVSEWAACSDVHGVETKASFKWKIIRAIKKLRFQRRLENTNRGVKPWFCKVPYSTVQVAFVRVLHILVTDFLVLTGIICFLDVFVTFFTGELSDKNGVLIPKPFLKRWILPGIVLQLLVNPQMETVGKGVIWTFSFLSNFGPDRVWRWTAVLFFPIVTMILHAMENCVWTPLVTKQNRHIVNVTTTTLDARKDSTRSISTTNAVDSKNKSDGCLKTKED